MDISFPQGSICFLCLKENKQTCTNLSHSPSGSLPSYLCIWASNMLEQKNVYMKERIIPRCQRYIWFYIMLYLRMEILYHQPKHHIKDVQKSQSSICLKVYLDLVIPNVIATQWDWDKALLFLRSIAKLGGVRIRSKESLSPLVWQPQYYNLEFPETVCLSSNLTLPQEKTHDDSSDQYP